MVSPGMLWTSVGNDAIHRIDISPVILLNCLIYVYMCKTGHALCFLMLKISHFRRLSLNVCQLLCLLVARHLIFTFKSSIQTVALKTSGQSKLT